VGTTTTSSFVTAGTDGAEAACAACVGTVAGAAIDAGEGRGIGADVAGAGVAGSGVGSVAGKEGGEVGEGETGMGDGAGRGFAWSAHAEGAACSPAKLIRAPVSCHRIPDRLDDLMIPSYRGLTRCQCVADADEQLRPLLLLGMDSQLVPLRPLPLSRAGSASACGRAPARQARPARPEVRRTERPGAGFAGAQSGSGR
jgi:hypothetical protein